MAWDEIGNYTGSMNYDPNEDYVEVVGEVTEGT